MKDYDFSGWATRNDLKCSDGRTIKEGAFKHCDGIVVPLVWNHQHNDAMNVLGHALLENRKEGVYTYGKFNDTEQGNNAKELVLHGDVTSLSIYANQLQQNGGDVLHGNIREVSLVLAGANPGAYIDSVITHSDGSDETAIIYTGSELSLYHADDQKKEDKEMADQPTKEAEKNEKDSTEEKTKTVQDVIDSMTEEQKDVLYGLIDQALKEMPEEEEESEEEKKEGDEKDMKHNAFEQSREEQNTLMHSDMEAAVIADAKRYGSMKESFLAHAAEDVYDSTHFGKLGYQKDTSTGEVTPSYGIGNVDYLFPDAKAVTPTPEFIKRNTEWVTKVIQGTHHTPFSRIKSIFADITEDEARAKGYIKGGLKKDEVFGLLKRTTTPTTIYKKQKMDRDDVIDITDFDVIAWIKAEMRAMLEEEMARAILIGDGRLNSSDDKINEQNVRPIVSDHDLFSVKCKFAVEEGADKAKTFIREVIKSRKKYKGSGNPTLFTTEDMLTDMLLIEDGIGRPLYDTEEKLRTALRVKEIVTVEAMEGLTNDDDLPIEGIIVNLNDYNIGADKGGETALFEDFDIDYNQMKYLLETRISGALTKPFSALVLIDATDEAV